MERRPTDHLGQRQVLLYQRDQPIGEGGRDERGGGLVWQVVAQHLPRLSKVLVL